MRIKIIVFFIFMFYLLLIYRVYDLSVASYLKYEKLSKENIIKKLPIVPVRGVIYDKNGKPVAYNQLRFDIAIVPHLKPAQLVETIQNIVAVTDANASKILKTYKKFDSPYNYKPIPVVRYLTKSEVYKIEPILGLDENVRFLPTYMRTYPYKQYMANVLGYVSRANKNDLKRNPVIAYTQISGKRGIEKYYDDILQGQLGYKKVLVNAKNEVLKVLKVVPPKTHKIYLSIDVNLQKFIYDDLKKQHKKGAAVIVMRTNGEILALVSYPSYNDNWFVKGITYKQWKKLSHNVYNPLINKPVSGLYPPGSTVKPAEGLIASASGKWNPYKKIACPYYIVVGNRKFHGWKVGGQGFVDLAKSIQRSADVYYYKMGLKLGIDYIASRLKKMGFGHKTGIDLPNEKSGIVPDKKWKEEHFHQPWFLGETVNSVIGQGYFLATPIQVADVTALLATGKLPKPFLVKRIDGNYTKPVLKNVLTPKEKKFLPLVRKGMWEVCNTPGGTAYWHLHTKIVIAGKTGTAQVYTVPREVRNSKKEDELEYFKRPHAWLTTYGPYSHPQFVVTVLVEHGGEGSAAAGGIVSDIYNYLVDHGYISKKYVKKTLFKTK